MWRHSCSYVTQFVCGVFVVANGHPAFLHLFSINLSGFQTPHCLRWLLVSVLTFCPARSLTLIDSSLPLEAEPELRTYISRRLSKGALLGGMGNIATVELR